MGMKQSRVVKAVWSWNGGKKKQVLGTDEGFSGGSVVKNLPANPGDAGSIPGSGRSIPWRRK